MAHTLQKVPGWSVCRDYREIVVRDVDLLPFWAERGRLRPDDYLVNSRLEVCFQASEVPELNAIFRRTRKGPLKTILNVLGLL